MSRNAAGTSGPHGHAATTVSHPRAGGRPPDPRVARSRQRTLAATLDLVSERGVAGVTIEAISARSGIAKTTIYRQWPHQGALVLDALGTLAPDPPTPDTGTLRGDLIVLVGGVAEALGSGPAGVLMLALLDAAQRDPDFAKLQAQDAVRRHQPVMAALQRGLARGELAAGVDLDELLDRLTGPVYHRRFVSRLPLTAGFVERVIAGVLASP